MGDRTIVALTQIIKKMFRHTEIIGRISGDEIAVLDDGLTVTDTQEIVRGLLEQFAQVPHKAGGQLFRVTASAGIAHIIGTGTLDALLDRARAALKQAKDQGANQIVQL